ncbi:MAG: CBS domain-containing protein [Gammaproteobacteria bacterium]|nr:CBS domain-containing protein [Gammaproteobacteria bacterium]
MQHVKDILAHKSNQVWSVTPDTTVFDALKKMSDKSIGSLLVMEGEKLVGLFSERDYARKVVLHDKSSRTMPVTEIMTRRILCVSPERSVEECMALMTDQRVRHLPVIENKQVVGVVSIGDLVKAIMHDQQILIDQLQQYITG